MKKLLYTLVCLSFLLVTVSLQAADKNKSPLNTKLQQKKKMMDQKKHDQMKTLQFSAAAINPGNPGNSMDYYWADTEWFHTSNSEYYYDAYGNLVEEIVMDPTNMFGFYRTTYAYDEYQNFTEYIYYMWDGANWVINYGNRTVYTYGPNGEMLERLDQYYDYDMMEWVDLSRLTSVYDANGFVVEEIYAYWYEGAWYNEYRDVFTVDAIGAWLELTTYYWNGGEWALESRVIDIAWHNWELFQVASAIIQYYSGGMWYDDERITVTYNGNNYIMLYEMYWDDSWEPYDRETYTETATEHVSLWEYFITGEWMNDQRNTDYFDDHGQNAGYKYEYWEEEKSSASSGWVVDYYSVNVNTYDENDNMVETILQYWDYATQSLLNSNRYVFSNFTSSVGEIGADMGLKIFPNPATDVVEVHALNNTHERVNYRLMDLTGKVVLTGDLSGAQSVIPVHQLHQGLYILHVTNAGGAGSSYKIMKN